MGKTEQDRESDSLAAEYVLGTLNAAERADIERRRGRDPELASAIAAWELRLDPLLASVAAVAPPPGALNAIKQKIAAPPDLAAGKSADRAEIVRLESRLRNWRRAAIGLTALAASLIAFVAFREMKPVPDGRFIAILESKDRSPAFLATVSVAQKAITIMRVGDPPTGAAGHSHELWAVGGDRAAPRSLGLLNTASQIPTDRLGPLDAAGLGGTSFAISLEPEGGSPTGQPTGPILFTGKLMPAAGN